MITSKNKEAVRKEYEAELARWESDARWEKNDAPMYAVSECCRIRRTLLELDESAAMSDIVLANEAARLADYKTEELQREAYLKELAHMQAHRETVEILQTRQCAALETIAAALAEVKS